MSDADLREKLREIVAEVAELDDIPDSEPFKELGIDSMMAIEIIAEVERAYRIKVPEEELQRVTDLDSMVTLIKSHLS